MHTPDHLITEKQFAEMLKRSVATIRRDRRAGRGPKFIRIGRQIRYRLEDVQAYIAGLAQLIVMSDWFL